MTATMICGCADPDCQVNGCKQMRATNLPNYPVPPAHTGWVCPKCNQGVSPALTRCPCSQTATLSPLFPIPSTSGNTTISWSPETGWREDQAGDPMVVTPTS